MMRGKTFVIDLALIEEKKNSNATEKVMVVP